MIYDIWYVILFDIWLLGQHYTVEKKDQKVEMTPAGFKYAEQIVGKKRGQKEGEKRHIATD